MITWIIPVYNGEKYIKQTIFSILNQPCTDLKIIVVDDGSTDKTLMEVSSITDERINIIACKNNGVSVARNIGIDSASTKYIAFLDADDMLCKDAYDDSIHEILKNNNYDILSFSYYNGDQNLRRGNRVIVKEVAGECNELELDPFKHGSSMIYRKEILNGDKKVRYPLGIRVREDVVFQFLAYCNAETIMFVDKDWSVYRNNDISVMHNLSSYDYLINQTVKAWGWAKNECYKKEDKDFCDIRIFAEIVDYISLSCGAGKSLKDIQKVLNCMEFSDCLKNYDILWANYKSTYEEFISNPDTFFKCQRRIGKVNEIKRKLAANRFIRKLYFTRKYKQDIRNVVF